MSTTLTVYDETTAGERGRALEISFPSERITVRELIRERVYQEVKDFNADSAQGGMFRGLVQPTGAEATLNGYKLKKPRMIDWEPQFERALEAYESNSILLLVDDRQTGDLDEEITVRPGSEVVFLKLVPLVGG